MKIVPPILARLSSEMDDVAAGMARLGARLRRRRIVELIEQENGLFLLTELGGSVALPLRIEDGGLAPSMSRRMRSLLVKSVVEIELAPSRFVFRPLELPRGADQFLEGVVRSQIDRLTPWSANEAAFGWSDPIQQRQDRISVVVAATPMKAVGPIARVILATGAVSVRLSTRAGETKCRLIPTFDQQSMGASASRRLKRSLIAAAAIAGFAFVVSFGAWIIAGSEYASRLAALQMQSANRRAELTNTKNSGVSEAIRALEERKRATPSVVMTLEALSKILPDEVYLTEMRIEDGNVQISGVANDAATLIGLIEQSRRFTRATFYAPTVRNPDGGETFHIQGRIEPSFMVTN
jgi:general secretion pathway protein L